MERQYTQQEINAFQESESELRLAGLEVDDEKIGGANANVVRRFFDDNPKMSVTVEEIKAICFGPLKHGLVWRSAAEQEYHKLYNQLTKDQQNQFGTWWFNQKHTLILEGDEGYENAAQIISWMKGKVFSDKGLNLAVSNLAGNSHRPLHWAQSREQQSPGRPGHQSDGKGLFSKSDTNLSARESAARNKPTSNLSERPSTDYKREAEEVRGATHSRTEQIQRMYVMKKGTSDIDWEQTYRKRHEVANR